MFAPVAVAIQKFFSFSKRGRKDVLMVITLFLINYYTEDSYYQFDLWWNYISAKKKFSLHTRPHHFLQQIAGKTGYTIYIKTILYQIVYPITLTPLSTTCLPIVLLLLSIFIKGFLSGTKVQYNIWKMQRYIVNDCYL